MSAPVLSTPQRQQRRRSALWKSFRASPANLMGLVIVVLFFVFALGAPLVTLSSPYTMQDGAELMPPSAGHWLGTDEFGRDIYARVVYGSRISLLVGFGGVLTAAFLGTMLGLLSGFAGPRSVADVLVMRAMDVLLAFPAILIGVLTVVLLGAAAVNVAIAVAVANIPPVVRLVRAEVLRERERDYVIAASALGASEGRILVRHLLPNTISVIIVHIATSLGAAILLEAALSFLGLGAQPPNPSWGTMLRDSRSYLVQAPWYAIVPGAALTLLIIGVNFTGNALRLYFRRRA